MSSIICDMLAAAVEEEALAAFNLSLQVDSERHLACARVWTSFISVMVPCSWRERELEVKATRAYWDDPRHPH
jgi:hypothetical protein